MNLRTYLFVGFTLVAALPIALLLGIYELSIRNYTHWDNCRMSRSVALSAAESVSAILTPTLYELEDIAATLDNPRVGSVLSALRSIDLSSHTNLESLLILDSKGNSILAVPGNPARLGHNFGAFALFNAPRLHGGFYFTDSFLSFQNHNPTAAVSTATGSGMVVVGNLNLQTIFNFVERTARELNVTVRVLDERGVVIAAPDRKEAQDRVSYKDILDAAAATNWGGGEGFRYTQGKKPFLAFSSPVDKSPWRTLVSFQERDMEAFSSFIRTHVILGGLISLSLSLSVAFFLSRYIRYPLGELLASVRGVAGDVYPQGGHSRSLFSEMDELLTEFSNMQRQVHIREEELRGALASRELLLKEVHHRVKNNLQIVASLLALQRERIENPEAFMALSESAQRVYALSLVHEKLYQSTDFATLDLGEYLEDFCRGLLDAFGAMRDFDFLVERDFVETDIDTTIPIGLCVNEILSNSIKYGHGEEGKKSTIRFTLKKEDPGFFLSLSDEGPGFDPEAARKSGSLGLVLIESLVTQIHGTIKIDTSQGSRFEIRVPHSISRNQAPLASKPAAAD